MAAGPGLRHALASGSRPAGGARAAKLGQRASARQPPGRFPALDDAVRDALARVGRKVVPAVLREQADRWRELDEQQRAAVIAGINHVADILWPAGT